MSLNETNQHQNSAPLKTPRQAAAKSIWVLATVVAVSLVMQASPKYSAWSVPVNLGPINSPEDDYLVDVSKDGLSLYFTSTRPGFGGEDIWVSQRARESDPWGPPMNIGPLINTTFNERSPTLSRDGHFMFFVTDRPGGFGMFDIWVARREHVFDNFAWEPAVNLGPGVNSSFNDAGPGFFQNEDSGTISLYFASNRPGGIGVFDIYVSNLGNDGIFAPAVLVPELSSPLSELRPSLRHDGLEIFFTLGTGTGPLNRDLWTSVRSAVSLPWSAPVSLGPIVNTNVEDSFAAVSSDNVALYFSSNRSDPNALGGLDLYLTTRNKISPHN